MSGIVLGTKGKQFDENLPLSLYLMEETYKQCGIRKRLCF